MYLTLRLKFPNKQQEIMKFALGDSYTKCTRQYTHIANNVVNFYIIVDTQRPDLVVVSRNDFAFTPYEIAHVRTRRRNTETFNDDICWAKIFELKLKLS